MAGVLNQGFTESEQVPNHAEPAGSLVTSPTSADYHVCILCIPREPIFYKMIGRHARPRLFCTFHQNPIYCVKTRGFPKDPHFWSGMLDMLTFLQERPTTFSLGLHSEQQSTRCFPGISVHSWILPLISHHLVQGPWPVDVTYLF